MIVQRLAALCAAAAVLAGCVSVQPVAENPEAYFAADYSCAAKAATQVDLGSLLAAPQRYDGRCVRLYGFAKGATLYRDGEAAATPHAPALALSYQDRALARRLRLGPSFVHLIGRARDCAHRRKLLADGKRAPEACAQAPIAVFVSKAEIVPTAMD